MGWFSDYTVAGVMAGLGLIPVMNTIFFSGNRLIMGGVCLLFGKGCERLDMLITANDGILI